MASRENASPEMVEVGKTMERKVRRPPPKLQTKAKPANGNRPNRSNSAPKSSVHVVIGNQVQNQPTTSAEEKTARLNSNSHAATDDTSEIVSATVSEPAEQSEKTWAAEKEKLKAKANKFKQQAIRAVEARRVSEENVTKLSAQLADALKIVQDTQNELKALQEEFTEADTAAQSLSQECTDLENEANKALETMQKDHSKQIDAKDAQIRQLLNQAMAGKAEGRWNPTPDGETRRQLTVLNNEIRSFSKEWAATSMQALQPLMKVPVVARYYARFVRVTQSGFPPLFRKAPAKLMEKLPAVLLNAAIADEVQDSFFGNPFFCVAVEAQPVFKKTFSDLMKVNTKEAHTWRCLLWRLSCPKDVNLQRATNEHYSDAENNIREYIKLVEECFSKCPVNLLFKEPLTEADRGTRAASLLRIFQSAAMIAIDLWRQPSHLSSLTLPVLWHQNTKFDVNSNILQGHPLSKVDEDDPEHNGRAIAVVTRPALLVFDSEEEEIISESKAGGSNGDGYRVLAKAVVLLDDKA